MISILTLGDSATLTDETTKTTSSCGEEGEGVGGTRVATVNGGGGGAGLASMVELQEEEIVGLKQELSEALSRVPRGGGEGGGVSALEEALKNQVNVHTACIKDERVYHCCVVLIRS